MQVQAINNNQTFGATLKIHRNKRDIERPVINWLEKEFPKRTKGIKGHLLLSVGFRTPYNSVTDKLKYSNGKHNRYKTYIECFINHTKSKEQLLDILVNSLDGFIIKENAHNKIVKLQKKIDKLKEEIKGISDTAYYDCANLFCKQFYDIPYNL